MKTRPLGRTGLSVSALSLGTMTWGEQNTDEEGFAQMDYAFARGLNLFDNAELYPIPPKAETQGRTEDIMGRWMEDRGVRDKVIVATKVVGRSSNGWFRDSGQPARLTAADIEEAVNKSLKRLRTDRIDLYQVHWPDRAVAGFGSNPTVFNVPDRLADEVPIEESLKAMETLVQAGKVLHIGLSNESTWGVMQWLSAAQAGHGPRVASIQNAYNLLNRTFEVNLAEACMREDVSLLCYSALAQGYLTGKYRNGALPAGSRKTLFDRLQRYEGPGAVETNDRYVKLAEDAGLDPSKMAIAFAMSRPFMTSVIIGATSMEQLKVCIDAADVTLGDDLLGEIDSIHRAHANPAP
ncbi:MAG: aldo/keto reductase [Pseudomonadota bacterium]